MAVLKASEDRFRFRCTDSDAIFVLTVKAILNSLVDRNGRFSKSGEVHFSRKTYSFVIADEIPRLSQTRQIFLKLHKATTTYVGHTSGTNVYFLKEIKISRF
jgi:restriction endonuclease S subunit